MLAPTAGWPCSWINGPGVCSGPAVAFCSTVGSYWHIRSPHLKPPRRSCRTHRKPCRGWYSIWAPSLPRSHAPHAGSADRQGTAPWRIAAWTSAIWMVVLDLTITGFLTVLERQDRKLELPLERTAPASQAPMPHMVMESRSVGARPPNRCGSHMFLSQIDEATQSQGFHPQQRQSCRSRSVQRWRAAESILQCPRPAT